LADTNAIDDSAQMPAHLIGFDHTDVGIHFEAHAAMFIDIASDSPISSIFMSLGKSAVSRTLSSDFFFN